MKPGDCPIHKKEQLVAELRLAIDEAIAFCVPRGLQVQRILNAEGFQHIACVDDAATNLVEKKVVDAVEKVILNDGQRPDHSDAARDLEWRERGAAPGRPRLPSGTTLALLLRE
jgi:hypothetical protein